MFALSKLARKPGRVKPSSALAVRNHSGRIGNKTGSGGASGNSQRTNLNDSNRPVRIRMPGGVGGDRSAYAGRPYPDYPLELPPPLAGTGVIGHAERAVVDRFLTTLHGGHGRRHQ